MLGNLHICLMRLILIGKRWLPELHMAMLYRYCSMRPTWWMRWTPTRTVKVSSILLFSLSCRYCMIHIIPKLYIGFKMMPYNAKQFHLSSRSLTSPSLSCNSGTVCIKCALYTCTVPNLFLVLENYILPFQIVLPSQQDLPLPLLQFLHILQSASWQPNPLQRRLQIFQQLVLISILVIWNEWPFWWRGKYLDV